MPDNAADRAERQKKFYTKQRVDAEERADEGDSRARDTVSKINKKLGRSDRQYTDTEAVNKDALSSVAGPEGIGEGLLAKGALKLGGKMLGKVFGKAASKGVGKLTEDAPKPGAKNVTPKASAEKPSPAKALPGRKALSGGKDAVKEAPKAGEPKSLGPGKKTGAEMRKSAVSRKARAAKGTKGKDPIEVAPKKEEAPKATRKARAPKAAAKTGPKEEPKAAEAPKKSAEEHADAAAKQAIRDKAMKAKARMKADLAKKGKLKKGS